MPTLRIRRILTAAILAVGTGIASPATASSALADDVGPASGGPLVEAEPTVPFTPLPLPSGPLVLLDELEESPEDTPPAPCPDEGCESGEEDPPVDGCTVEEPCGPEEDGWTETDGGCFFHHDDRGRVYCPGDEHPVPLDEDGCFVKNDHVYCPGTPEPPDTPLPDCPLTHVSDSCLPADTPHEPGSEPGDGPGETPADRPHDAPADRPRADSGLPVTGPGLALLAGTGGLLTAVGAGGLLLYRRRDQHGDGIEG
ncbi:hypothetical protein NI17_016645 [Thermobifida halotolerans]|uniref:Uncharacterized protein n=1 Tax=Thermobifida halotolerans TaxID=483545 RepID=A0A399G2I4_9ACTN|nr:hypothetical protein [Thermobifida halotolerans]UOE18441.1 hypothetical protein NI17_016645 [Thermobifida halotolerans]